MRRIATTTVLLAVTACGGGDTGTDTGAAGSTPPVATSTAPSTPAATEASTPPPVKLSGTVNDKGTEDLGADDELRLDLGDNYFAPTYVKGTPGTTVTVELTNSGRAPHTFTIDAQRVDVMVPVGEDAKATVTLPASGTLAFYCKIHLGQGMQGGFYTS